jgi:ubiquinone/menaquinone biosynthesis C-methylase UbiE
VLGLNHYLTPQFVMSVSSRPRFLQLKSHKYINYKFFLDELVLSSKKNGCLLLDAGCGKGDSISYSPDKVQLVCVDSLRSNVVACRGRWRKRSYVVADLTMLPFCEGAFEGVVCADVLEHIDDKTATINEFATVTREGGFFIGCSSNILNLILWLDVKFQGLMKPLVMKFADARHYDRHSRFSPSSLAKTLKSAGYLIDCLCLLGYPQFSVERSSSQGIALPWILFDRLTNVRILRYFKEILVWRAKRV